MPWRRAAWRGAFGDRPGSLPNRDPRRCAPAWRRKLGKPRLQGSAGDRPRRFRPPDMRSRRRCGAGRRPERPRRRTSAWPCPRPGRRPAAAWSSPARAPAGSCRFGHAAPPGCAGAPGARVHAREPGGSAVPALCGVASGPIPRGRPPGMPRGLPPGAVGRGRVSGRLTRWAGAELTVIAALSTRAIIAIRRRSSRPYRRGVSRSAARALACRNARSMALSWWRCRGSAAHSSATVSGVPR